MSGRRMSGRRTSAHAIWTAALVLFAAGAGCSVLISGGPTNVCESDDDCSSARCDLDRSMCVSEPSGSYQVGLEVVPAQDPLGGTVLPVSFAPFDLAAVGERDLELPLGTSTMGHVRDIQTGASVAANMRLSMISAIPGGPTVDVDVQAVNEASEDPRRDGMLVNFATQILPGRRYQLVVQPTGEWRAKRPPIRPMAEYLSPEAGVARIDFLTYPNFCSVPEQSAPPSDGCLVRVQGVVVDAEGATQDGLILRAVTASGRVLSSTMVTGENAELGAGRFELVMFQADWASADGWFLEITPSAERIEAEGPAPTFTVDPAGLYEEAGIVTVLMPSTAAIVTYEGWVDAASGAPLDGASLRFTSTDIVDDATGVVGRFSATATTEAGRYQVRLLPGTYDVLVTPPAREANLAVHRLSGVLISAPASGSMTVGGMLFEVPERVPLGGTVRTVMGEGMLDAQVRANPRGTTFGDPPVEVARFARAAVTATDLDGRFALPLDVGVYDLVFEPPVGSNFPWLVLPDNPIRSDSPVTSVYDLQNPVVLSGTARFTGEGDLIPVNGGEIRAYAVLEGSDGRSRAVQIGRASIDADGRYTLLLPPSL
ncbi:MAG: carboxypeptidase-like regulatory domain-containing protein [Sandaracinaceae bacterium]